MSARCLPMHVAAAALAVGFATLAAWSPAGLAHAQDAGRPAAEEADPVVAIERVLDTQRQAWNDGDIEAFLEPYWKSEGLSFSSGGETRRGFRATRDRYLATYPDRQAMGTLEFSALEISPLGDDVALVLGEWDLARDAGAIGGNFSLVMRRIDGRWLIVHDHTSRRDGPRRPAPPVTR